MYFSQMLLNICSESRGLEGLLSGSELQSLLIATTCLREHSCFSWKAAAFCVLRAISKAQSPSVIQYLRCRFQETRCGLRVTQGVPLAQSKAPGPTGSVSISTGFWKEVLSGQLTQYTTPTFCDDLFVKISVDPLDASVQQWERGPVYHVYTPTQTAGGACMLISR